MKIAIVHEMLVKLGGAEKVVQKLLDIFPEADLYTLIYDEQKVAKVFPRKYGKGKEIRVAKKTQSIYDISFGRQRLCLPFMPSAIESLDLSKYDVVIVSSSGFAHGVITKPETKTIIYYHSPARYLWDWTNEYKKDIGWNTGIKGWIIGNFFKSLREWDFIVSQRNSISLANSENVAQRVQKYYRKDAKVVYPPIEVSRFQKSVEKNIFEKLSEKYAIQSKGYYIVLGALTEFKKVDIALNAFMKMPDMNLLVVGEGNLKKKFEAMTAQAQNIQLIGAQYGDELVSLVQNAKALIFPGEEDFGMVPVEAMGGGIPVFAYKAGGLLESVIPGLTGEFFEHPEAKDFERKLREFEKNIDLGKYPQDILQKHAQKFDETVFEETMRALVEEK